MSDVTGVYSNKQILEALERDHIVIHPFIDKPLVGSSYDVTLGELIPNWRPEDMLPRAYKDNRSEPLQL